MAPNFTERGGYAPSDSPATFEAPRQSRGASLSPASGPGMAPPVPRLQPFVPHSRTLVGLSWTLRAPLGIVSASRPLPGGGTPMEDRPIEARRTNVSVLGLLLGTGPRFARDAIGPVLVFYVGWRLAGLAPAIVAATGVPLPVFILERRRRRDGLAARRRL